MQTNNPPDDSKTSDYDPFKFSASVRGQAWSRQNGHCGFCGEDLATIMRGDGELGDNNDRVEAHHVVSRQVGKLFADVEKVVAFIRSVVNCIYLCGDCHLRNAHGHDFGEGGLRPPEGFLYSHGGQETQARKRWVSLAKSIWIQMFTDPSKPPQSPAT
jgi:hypothetical protein